MDHSSISRSLFFALVVLAQPGLVAQQSLRASVDSLGSEGNGNSQDLVVSADGSIVAFTSSASNLVPGDSNFVTDVFVHDFGTGTTTRVSVTSAGGQSNNSCIDPTISGDGRYVAFASNAANLVPGDGNFWTDVFLHDRLNGTTVRASVDALGGELDGPSIEPALSADGSYLAFVSAATNLDPAGSGGWEVYVRDLALGTVERVSVDMGGGFPDGPCAEPSLSADGRFVVFSSLASNLVPNDTNGAQDLFVRDRLLGTTSRVNVTSQGAQTSAGGAQTLGGRISADGRFVTYWSGAGNIVPGDTNGYADVFLHDRSTGETSRISTDAAGQQANFPSRYPSITPDGRYVAFHSWASNLIPGDTNNTHDIFVRDLCTQQVTRVSLGPAGLESNGHSYEPAISGDGRYVVFSSDATNLVTMDLNAKADAFRYGPLPFAELVTTHCTAKVNSQGCTPQIGSSGWPSATDPAPFDVTASAVLNYKTGLLFYGYAAIAGIPFQGGTLCVAPPLRRTAIQSSLGSLPPVADCSGQYTFDFNALIQGGTDPQLVPGQEIAAQYWSRDSAHVDGTGIGLTDGVEFEICN